jgi:hypothetical protein
MINGFGEAIKTVGFPALKLSSILNSNQQLAINNQQL